MGAGVEDPPRVVDHSCGLLRFPPSSHLPSPFRRWLVVTRAYCPLGKHRKPVDLAELHPPAALRSQAYRGELPRTPLLGTRVNKLRGGGSRAFVPPRCRAHTASGDPCAPCMRSGHALACLQNSARAVIISSPKAVGTATPRARTPSILRLISAASLRCGKGVPGSLTPRNSHSGSQPSYTS